jgi:DNA-binding MarR family transcriptional regulator
MSADPLDALFAALSDAHRRALLSALSGGPRSAEALAQTTGLSGSAVLRHVRSLESAGWVRPVPRREGVFALRRSALARAGKVLGAWQGDMPAAEALRSSASADLIAQQAREWARQWPAQDPDVYLVGRRLLRLSAHIERAVKEAAASQQLLGAELLLIDALVTAGPPHVATPTQLQRSLHMTPGGVTKCIQRLEQAGLVERTPDPDDGRGVRVALQPKARELLRNIVEQGHYGTDWVAAMRMAPARRRQLATLLHELLVLADEEAQRRATAGEPTATRSDT